MSPGRCDVTTDRLNEELNDQAFALCYLRMPDVCGIGRVKLSRICKRRRDSPEDGGFKIW